MSELTDKQKRFVEEYLVDLNATQAAVRAGYSERTAEQQGYQLLQKTSVAAAVQAAMNARSERTQIRADRVLQEIARIGFNDIRKAMCWGSERVVFIPSEEVDEDTALAISEVSSETKVRTTDDATETTIKLKLKMHDKLGALRDLGRHLGLFKDRLEVTGLAALANALNGLPEAELRRLEELSDEVFAAEVKRLAGD